MNILHQQYGLKQSALIAGDDDPGLKKAVQESKALIHGHFTAKALLETPDYFKATMLREASDRLISRFVHIAHSEEERLRLEYTSYQSFEDFLASTYADNWQCRMLAGIGHEGRVNEEVYMKAADNLFAMDWVATSDCMPMASLDLSLKLGFKSFYAPRLNTRSSQKMWQEINAKFRPAIAELNRFDAQLVIEARALFNRHKNIPWSSRMKMTLKGLFSA